MSNWWKSHAAAQMLNKLPGSTQYLCSKIILRYAEKNEFILSLISLKPNYQDTDTCYYEYVTMYNITVLPFSHMLPACSLRMFSE